MKVIFPAVLNISLLTGLVILLVLLLSPFLNGRYKAKWKYIMWIVIALRLAIPIQPELPLRWITIPVPTQITLPAATDAKNSLPAASPVAAPQATPAELVPQTAAQSTGKALSLSRLSDIAAYIWLAGVCLFLSLHLFSFLHYKRRIVRDGESVDSLSVLRQFDRLRAELHIRQHVRIVRYAAAESPMVIGFRKPFLVLPEREYSEDELYFVLKHELIHIKRHDIYCKLLFVTANALHWFNPLVYLLQKEAVIDMELSCDERVIQQTAYTVRKAYTETLFSSLNRQYKKGTLLSTQFYGGKKIMKRRFINILAKTPKKNGLPVCLCIVILTLVSEVLVGCSSVAPSAIATQAPINPVQNITTNPDADRTDVAADVADASADVQTAIPLDPPAGTPFESMAYIRGVTDSGLTLDWVEWVLVPSDRADELGITEDDAPGGFDVYNEDDTLEELPFSDDVRITVIQWENTLETLEMSAEDFRALLADRGEQNEWIPYRFSVENGVITGIQEQYVP